MDFPETHQKGRLSIENPVEIGKLLAENDDIDFGLQVSHDGRVWVCINSIAWLRFKPSNPAMIR